MRAVVAAIALSLAGCSAGQSSPAGDGSGAGPTSDAGLGSGAGLACTVTLDGPTSDPVAGPASVVHVSALVVDGTGVPAFTWSVAFNGIAVPATQSPDGSAIDFAAEGAGVYQVGVAVSGLVQCRSAVAQINVRAPGALPGQVMLRAVVSDGSRPPFEQVVGILGGADSDVGTFVVPLGTLAAPVVRGPDNSGIPAYVRFSPDGSPDAIVEAFSASTGALAARVSLASSTVLVIPSGNALAAARFTGWRPGSPLALAAGATVSGAVVDPAGAPLIGATVELAASGVPSTVATTDASGHFAVLMAAATGAVTVNVTPPAATGLPRLVATLPAANFASGVQVAYRPDLVSRSLAGLTVARAGSPIANAQVMVVGELASAGTVTAGTPVTASGEVRITAVANASGVLPAVKVPAAALSAVVTAAAGDLAVAALDTTTAVPAGVDAPAMLQVSTLAVASSGDGLSGAVLDAVPVGALAMAAAPPVHVTASSTGVLAFALVAGGRYDLRLRDPFGRAAFAVLANRDPATIGTSLALAPAIRLFGTLTQNGVKPMANTSVQILCDTCNGPDRIPLAETVSDGAGRFVVAVPDPGTM